MFEDSGWTIEELSTKLKVPSYIINEWLNGKKNPTLRQIENLSKYIKRPLTAFLLPEPLPKQPLPHDYRMLPGRSGSFSKKTLLVIRSVRRLQSISQELFNNLNISPNAKITPAQIFEKPEIVAIRERINSGITIEEPKKWKDSYQAFEKWREMIEAKNILVFQLPVPIEDIRGFTLTENEPFIIVINSTDSIEARIFTLFHDYGHIILNMSGACFADPSIINEGTDAKIEKWCNEFAAAFLFPEDQAKSCFQNKSESELLDFKNLNKFSRMYKISKSALALAMLKQSFITQNAYQKLMDTMKSIKKKKKGGKGESLIQKSTRQKGQKFISLVTSNINEGFITNNDALDYLSIKLKDLKGLTL